jgi:hypothetical protein
MQDDRRKTHNAISRKKEINLFIKTPVKQKGGENTALLRFS